MDHFSYPLNIVQINIFEGPKIPFPNQNPRPKLLSQPPPRIFNYGVPHGLFSFSQFDWLIIGWDNTL